MRRARRIAAAVLFAAADVLELAGDLVAVPDLHPAERSNRDLDAELEFDASMNGSEPHVIGRLDPRR